MKGHDGMAKNPTQAMEWLYDSVDRANIDIGGPNVERPLALCLYVFQLFCNILWSGKYHLTISTQPQLFFHPFFSFFSFFFINFLYSTGNRRQKPTKQTHTQTQKRIMRKDEGSAVRDVCPCAVSRSFFVCIAFEWRAGELATLRISLFYTQYTALMLKGIYHLKQTQYVV